MADAVHIWHRCSHCGAAPLTGRCYRCITCPAGPDNDLCEACYRQWKSGHVTHPSAGRLTATPEPHEFEAYDGRSTAHARAWLEVPWRPAQAPAVPDRFVVRPEFRARLAVAFGAHGCVVEGPSPGDSVLFVTALHVMDELIKSTGIDATVANVRYTGNELPAVVTDVVLYDVFAPNWMLAELGTAGPMLALPRARVGGEEPYSDLDVAAFWIGDASPFRPARLAESAPAVGDPIWLAVKRADGARCCPAVVVESTERTLVFRYADAGSVPDYCSGAPLLNTRGEVVGINVGLGLLDGESLGHANTVSSLRAHLVEGIARSPRPVP